jgi:hypothetical protein
MQLSRILITHPLITYYDLRKEKILAKKKKKKNYLKNLRVGQHSASGEWAKAD